MRKKLIREYKDLHYGNKVSLEKGFLMNPTVIVVHATATKTMQGAYNIFNRTTLRGRPDIQMGGRMNVSVPYLVDRDGTIYQLHDDRIMGRQCIGLNYCSIGIENVGGIPQAPVTKEQVAANVWLIAHLKKKYPQITYMIAHSEYRRCEKLPIFIEKMSSYRTKKVDPGDWFMIALRARLKKKKLDFLSCN
ncbi:MAG: peptidoglycan recognition family protein [Spirochaetota bacterium]